MSTLRFPLLFAGSKGEKRLYALFDSGANLSCIDEKDLDNLETAVHLGRIRKLATASEGHFIEISERVVLDFYIDDVLLSDEFLVVPNLSEEVIIGAATLQKWRIKLNFEDDKVEVDPKVAKLQLKRSVFREKFLIQSEPFEGIPV
jgi:predicted aspartyl protease